MDMYIEKIYLQRQYRDDQQTLDKVGLKRNTAEDLTANQQCRVKIKAVGLDYNIAKWLEDQGTVIKMLNNLHSADMS